MAIRLPRLPSGAPIVDPKTGIATAAYSTWWNAVLTEVESHITALEFDAAIAAAEAATAAAQAAADNANDATTSNARFLSISNSNVTGCTITATDAGTDVTVTISAHTRNYADGTSVAVAGGTVTGQPYSTQVFIYYDQASLAGGAVTYHATITGTNAFTTAAGGTAPDRHYVGSVVTPAAAGAPTDGAGAVPPSFEVPPSGNWF